MFMQTINAGLRGGQHLSEFRRLISSTGQNDKPVLITSRQP